MAITTYTLKVEWAKMISPTVRHIAFSRVDGAALQFIPGQFITLHFPFEDKILRRSYSLATVPGKSGLYELAAGFVKHGPGSELLFGLEPGDSIEASGPVGRLVLCEETLKQAEPPRHILVATGTGVTPYRAMLTQLSEHLKHNPKLKVCLFFGVQGPEHLLYGEEFEQFAQEHPNFEFYACYSRQMPENPKATEFQGYVQQHLEKLNLQPGHDHIYLCGNPNMIDQAFPLLQSLEFATRDIKREKYISSK